MRWSTPLVLSLIGFCCSIVATWFADGVALRLAVFAMVVSGLALIAALAPPRVFLCELCGRPVFSRMSHYRKAHDL